MGLISDVGVRLKTLNVVDYALISIFSALMAMTTYWAIPLPFGGLTHFGNTVMWTASILFGGLIGGVAGGIGGMIVDIVLAPIWAPFTPFCKLISGIACGLVAGDTKELNTVVVVRIIVATIIGAAFNALAYAPVYWILLGYNSMIAWLVRFVLPSPAAIITYVATPILSLAVFRSFPGVFSIRDSIKDRVRNYRS